jgi:nitrate reductase gamma subunit
VESIAWLLHAGVEQPMDFVRLYLLPGTAVVALLAGALLIVTDRRDRSRERQSSRTRRHGQ